MNSHITNSIVWTHTENQQTIFDRIFEQNLWQSEESVSGKGSELSAAKHILNALPQLLKKYEIKTIIDAPCGDYNWMQYLNYRFESYIGIDIVDELINQNKKYETENKHFFQGNILDFKFPYADIILCRDCFIHLSFEQIFQSIRNLKNSKSKMILLSTYDIDNNKDVLTGQFRKINLCIPPFNFVKPIEKIRETNENGSKYLALWNLKDIKNYD